MPFTVMRLFLVITSEIAKKVIVFTRQIQREIKEGLLRSLRREKKHVSVLFNMRNICHNQIHFRYEQESRTERT